MRKHIVVCDRCTTEAPYRPSSERPLAEGWAVLFPETVGVPGWGYPAELVGTGDICPACLTSDEREQIARQEHRAQIPF
jgi:hypothetical protein